MATASRSSQTSPNFSFVLFETVALTLKSIKASPEASQLFENEIAGTLNVILDTSNNELSSYVF